MLLGPYAFLGKLPSRSISSTTTMRLTATAMGMGNVAVSVIALGTMTMASGRIAKADETVSRPSPHGNVAERDRVYADKIKPFLTTYCLDCHSEEPEANLRLDASDGASALLEDRELWLRVLKNVRADLMPPLAADQPANHDRQQLIEWIETSVFNVDPTNPDPGPMPVRRLNRTEYRNTIRDLMGVDFNADVVFPPDDTGFGFDNVGDALSISPLLLEKYVQSAGVIVSQAVPTVTWQVPKRRVPGNDFRSVDGEGKNGDWIRYDKPTTLSNKFQAEHPGSYRITVREKLHGSFDFHPGRYAVAFEIDGAEQYAAKYKWEENKEVVHELAVDWQAGDHELRLRLTTLDAEPGDPEIKESSDGDENYVAYQISDVVIEGPVDAGHREHPSGYTRFFSLDEPPASQQQRDEYRRQVLERFATRAFRRPPTPATLDRLCVIARDHSDTVGESFEAGVAKAITAVLASPRFLFKLEGFSVADNDPQAASGNSFVLIDEYALAARLSYLFWSSMPDDELFELAAGGQLRANLEAQAQRMLRDERAGAFARNFVGQWLRARDIEHVSIDPVAAMGHQREYDELRQQFLGRFRRGRSDTPPDPATAAALKRYREIASLRDKLNPTLRSAMRRETEMAFEYIVENDRSLLELIDADYIFANEALAELYGIENVEGKEMRRIELPADSPRGGVLTQGTMLTVTSNPTRTSPVKRGLFILENLLGTPSPPAPPNVPALEDSANRFGDREPSLRELLAVHREAAICTSCHARMDPLGLALENFNAFGLFRAEDKGASIDVAGELITGEKFTNVSELKKILASSRRLDFYRCATEKMFIFALGRGLELQDEWSVGKIAAELDRHEGRFSALLSGIIQSAPFQKMRRPEPTQLTAE